MMNQHSLNFALNASQECTKEYFCSRDTFVQGLGAYTWPGIEYGQPPSFKHSFFEYVDALRYGNLQRFKEIEAECSDWWFPTLDRGDGACLHFAVDHGQLEAVKFLVEKRGAYINQQDRQRGWTPLMRCAQMAHYTNQPYLQVFEYLLQQGADPEIRGKKQSDKGEESDIHNVAVEKGRGWEPGEVRAKLTALVTQHKGVPKKPAYTYDGPPFGPNAMAVLEAWEKLPDLHCPTDWRPPPAAGFHGSQGIRLASQEPWRPAGDNDGSCFLRPMTEAELLQQSKSVQAV